MSFWERHLMAVVIVEVLILAVAAGTGVEWFAAAQAPASAGAASPAPHASESPSTAPDISDCESAKIRVAHLELIIADQNRQLAEKDVELKKALEEKAANAANKAIEDVKATHKFGADVQFDPATDRFFRTTEKKPAPAKK